MLINSTTAIAHPNIALIKYWGEIDSNLHIPASGSISMNLAELITRTTVRFDTSLLQDQIVLNGERTIGKVSGTGKLLSRSCAPDGRYTDLCQGGKPE